MQQLINRLHEFSKEKYLDIAPKKSCFKLLIAEHFGRKTTLNTIKSFQSKNAAILKTPSPTTKLELKRFIGSINFFSELSVEIHVTIKLLYESLLVNLKTHRRFEIIAD